MSENKLSEEMKQKIVHLFIDESMNVTDISKQCQLSSSTVSYILKINDIDAKAIKATRHQEACKKATEEYINGALMKDAANKYGISVASIEHFMKQQGITYRSQHGRKNFFNQGFFHDITTEAQAYFLGFLYADGCISGIGKNYTRLCRVTINISAKDRIILEQFISAIQASGNLHIHEYMPNETTYANNPMCKLVLNSTQMADDLIILGYSGLKSDRLSLPKIPQHLYRHFVRGYFDGDGCITARQYSITGYTKFLRSLNTLLHEEINIPLYNKYISYPHLQADISDLRIARKDLTSAFYHYMYDDANYYLPRKKLFYQEYHM